MSKPTKPYPVLFFTGLIYADFLDIANIAKILEENYGPIEEIMKPVDFHWTSYYAEEMGKGLKRTWAYFKELIQPEELIAKKHISYEIEKRFANENSDRILNIDPGIVTPAKLILSTYKDFSHRIYLGEGVYAEITLIFKDGQFQNLEWTYSDYADEENQKFFYRMRHYLKTKLGVMKNNGEI
ncbi:MAG: DUF4416 family protein [Candidatus Zixiibacteriota bacterium]